MLIISLGVEWHIYNILTFQEARKLTGLIYFLLKLIREEDLNVTDFWCVFIAPSQAIVKTKLTVIKYHVIKTMEQKYSSTTLDLGTRWR
jgi:hypothetical protein